MSFTGKLSNLESGNIDVKLEKLTSDLSNFPFSVPIKILFPILLTLEIKEMSIGKFGTAIELLLKVFNKNKLLLLP